MWTEYKLNVSYWKAWKADEYAKTVAMGTPEESFALLPSYCHFLERANPGTKTTIAKTADNVFKYLYIAFGPSIRAFPIMKKVRKLVLIVLFNYD